MERSLTYFDDIWQNALDSRGEGMSREDSEVLRVQVDETTIRLGKLLGLLPTSLGNTVASSFWLSIEVAAFLAVVDFNQRSSPFSDSLSELTQSCNFFLTMDFRNSAFSPIVAGKEWQDTFLFSDEQNQIRPMAVVGPVRSEVSNIVSTLGGVVTTKDVEEGEGEETPTSGSGGIPNISPTARSARLDNTEQYPFFGRLIPTNAGEAMALCRYLDSINVRQLAVLHVSDTYGIDFLIEVQKAARQFGISISAISYNDGLDESLTAVSGLANEGYKYFFGIFSAGSIESLLLRLYDQELMSRTDLVWIFGETIHESFGLKLSTSNERDMKLADALNGTGAVLLNAPERELGIFQQLLEDFHGDEALMEYYLSLHLSGPLAGRDPLSFRNDIFAPKPSIYAMMAYDVVLGLGIGACEIESDFFTGPELFKSFKNIDFSGATERVLFNKSTGLRDESYLRYQIYNLIAETNETGETVTITAYKSQLITLQNESIEVLRDFVFFGGNTTPPLGQPLPTENLNLVSDGVRSICWVLSGTVILSSVYCIVCTIRRRKTPIVRASQPIFLVMLCAGTFLMSCSIIPTTLQEPVSERLLDAACMLDLYLFSVGFSMTFAALFSKTWRINILLANSKKFRRVTIRPRDVLLPFVILMVLNLAILVSFTVVAPLQWERVIVEEDMFGQAVESRGTCLNSVQNRESTEMTFLCLLVVVNVTALFLSNYQSYRARKLPSEFNETLYLAMTNLVILEGMVLGVPILFVVGDDPASFMLIRSLLVTIICLAVLVTMFVPKFYWAKDEKLKRHVANATSEGGNSAQPTSRGGNLGGIPSATTHAVTTTGVGSIADTS